MRWRASLVIGPVLLALALALTCARPRASSDGSFPSEGRDVLRLVRETSRARRLEVDHARLAPRVLARTPEALTWTATNARLDSHPHAFAIAEVTETKTGFEVTSVLPSTPGVGYTIRAVVEGDAAVALRVENADGREWSNWESSGSAAASPVVETSNVADGRKMEIRLKGTGSVIVRELEVRESLLREPTQLVSSADYDLRAFLRQTRSAHEVRGREALLATGSSTYEWTWAPVPAPRVLDFETGLVPRDGEAIDPSTRASVTAIVDVWSGDVWREAYRAVRGGAGDDGQWTRASVDLGDARGVRLRTEGAATLAWARPVVRPKTRADRPDVVLVTLDALRASDLGAYGGAAGLSPAFDRLAQGGVVFEEARAARGQTWESLTAIAHGSRPEAVGVHDRGDRRSRGHDGIAGVFADAGYLTVRLGNALLPAEQLGEMDIDEDQARDDLAMSRLQELLETEHERPIFAWVHLSSTHYPYHLTPDFVPAGEPAELPDDLVSQVSSNGGPETEIRLLSARSDAAVREDDALVGRLLPELQREGRPGGPALVALSADHGSHRGEQGLWFTHSTVSRAVLRVPLVVSWPGHVAPRRVDRLVRLIDLGPTLLDYARLPDDGFEGRTLRPLMEGRSEPGRINVVTWNDITVVEDDRYKVVATTAGKELHWADAPGARLAIPPLSLFAWRTDGAEAHDLSREEPLVVRSLLGRARDLGTGGPREAAHDAARLLRQAGYAAQDDGL